MKKRLLLVLLFSLLPVSAWAEGASPLPEDRANNAFGASLGWITGSGIMYRHYFNDNYAQLGFIAYYNADTKPVKKYGNLAFMVGRYVHYTDFSNRFFPIALKVNAGGDIEVGEERDVYDDNGYSVGTRIDDYLHFGAGIGVDIGNPNQKGFALSVELTYIASIRNFYENDRELVFIEPRPGVSFFYNF